MNRPSRTLLAPLAIVAIAAAGCGVGSATAVDSDAADRPPVALEVERPRVIPGEMLRFELSLRGVIGGEAVVVMGQPTEVDGRQLVAVRSRARSTGVAKMIKEVSDDVVTWMDARSGFPVRLRADTKFGKKEALIESSFNDGEPGAFKIRYKRRGRPLRRYNQRMPADTAAYDGHSILTVLRGWGAPVGGRAYFFVLAGKRLWHNTVSVAEVARITTKLGRFKARRIDGVGWRLNRSLERVRHKKSRHYTMWITDDEDRIPILVTARTEYGQVKVELIERAVGPLQARAD